MGTFSVVFCLPSVDEWAKVSIYDSTDKRLYGYAFYIPSVYFAGLDCNTTSAQWFKQFTVIMIDRDDLFLFQ